MIELFQELSDASALLRSALQRYLAACVALQSYCQNNQSFDHRQTLRDVAVRELVSVSSHDITLRNAKSTIGQARNKFTPVYALPVELLGSIFNLVVGSRPCGTIEYSSPDIDAPKFPSYLLRVCSYWRYVALNTPSLWTHIDLAPGHLMSPVLAERAELATAHSSGLLLDIHIRETDSLSLSDNSHARLLDLIRRVATRTRSFEFTIPETVDFLSTRHSDILECCFNTCVPRTLDKLVIKQRRGGHMFLEASNHQNPMIMPVDFHDQPLAVPAETIEDLLLPVTSLTLENLLFPWTYSAYRNLTELRLITSTKTGIRVSELVAMLVSSPRLRVFQFDLDTDWPAPDAMATIPVQLQFLEVLKVGLGGFSDFTLLAPFLAPGSRPLQFCFSWYRGLSLGENHPITKFIEQSNATKICVRETSGTEFHHGSKFIDEIIRTSPQLQILALERFAWPILFAWDSDPYQPPIPTSSRLNALYLLECHIDVDTLRGILESCQVKTLTLWKCAVAKDPDWILSGPEIEQMFSYVCPDIRVRREHPSPVEDWL